MSYPKKGDKMKKKFFIGIIAGLLFVPMAVFAKGNLGNPEAKITTCGDVTNCKLSITKQGSIYGYGHKLTIKEAPGGFCESDTSLVTKATCEAANKTWYRYSLIYVDDSKTPVNLAKDTYTDTVMEESWNDGEFTYSQAYDASLTGEMATNTTNGFNLFDSVIVGGSKNEALTADTNVIMDGGTVYAIYGGNSAYSYNAIALSANLTGNTNVTYNGGVVITKISGGSQVSATSFTGETAASANISGNVTITYDLKDAKTNEIPLYVGSVISSGVGTSVISGTKTLNITSSGTITSSDIVGTADVLNVQNAAEITIGATMPVTKTLNAEANSKVVFTSTATVPATLKITAVPLASVENNTVADIKVSINGTDVSVSSESEFLTIANGETEADTSVLVTGVITPDAQEHFVLTKTDLTTGDVYTKMIAFLDKDEKSIGLFDLSLGEGMDYSGKLTVTILLGSTYANKAVTVRHLAADATEPEEFNVTADSKGVVTIQVDSLSPIMVSQTVVENPNTIDNVVNAVVIGSISIIGALCAVMYFKKREN